MQQPASSRRAREPVCAANRRGGQARLGRPVGDWCAGSWSTQRRRAPAGAPSHPLRSAVYLPRGRGNRAVSRRLGRSASRARTPTRVAAGSGGIGAIKHDTDEIRIGVSMRIVRQQRGEKTRDAVLEFIEPPHAGGVDEVVAAHNIRITGGDSQLVGEMREKYCLLPVRQGTEGSDAFGQSYSHVSPTMAVAHAAGYRYPRRGPPFGCMMARKMRGAAMVARRQRRAKQVSDHHRVKALLERLPLSDGDRPPFGERIGGNGWLGPTPISPRAESHAPTATRRFFGR